MPRRRALIMPRLQDFHYFSLRRATPFFMLCCRDDLRDDISLPLADILICHA